MRRVANTFCFVASCAADNMMSTTTAVRSQSMHSSSSKPPPPELMSLLRQDRVVESNDVAKGAGVRPSLHPFIPFNPFTGKRVSRMKTLASHGFVVDANDKFRLRLDRVPNIETPLFKRAANPGHKLAPWETTFLEILSRCGVTPSSTSAETGTNDVLEKINAEITALYDLRHSSAQLPAKLITTVDLDDSVNHLQNLTADQALAVKTAASGKCMYVAGSAGTGKTVVLKAIYAELVRKGLKVALTATTGAASVNLGGCTIHHALSIPVAAGASMSSWDLATLRSIDVLIVDEVSMLNMTALEGIDAAARHARMQNYPFGGLQIIFSGDFLQLSTRELCCTHDIFSKLTNVVLTTPLRHANQLKFLSLLQHVREGKLNSDDRHELARLHRGLAPGAPLPPSIEEAAVFLFPMRKSAKIINDQRLALIPAEEQTIRSILGAAKSAPHMSHGVWLISSKPLDKEDILQQLNKHSNGKWDLGVEDLVVTPMDVFQVESLPRLHLTPQRPFAQMCRVVNTPSIVAAAPDAVAACWGKVAASLRSVLHPVDPDNTMMLSATVLAALERNGMSTSDSNLKLKIGCRVVVTRNLSSTVINGSLGVVESFAPPMFSLFPQGVKSCNGMTVKITPKQFPLLPVVRMTATNERYQIPPITFAYGGGPTTHYFTQEVHEIPLQLGYAFTVHKVQGLTINAPVVVDFAECFTCPHLLYVALSRVRDPTNLYLRNVDESHVEVSRTCAEFEQRVQASAAASAAAASAAASSTTNEHSTPQPLDDTLAGSWVKRQQTKSNEELLMLP
ncbi:DNA repair and recombination precursor, putative [Bodo saltans]|uniref:ATP-dependent DNA helicase n=1 Tax=Bodo saltans TaxID=75058 RepID=A0A0S4IQF2_BODSA|nr:DNA repair and recombination precursor, putative [Bodo saltans]|eukprot:CUF95200.1 DNA repair and recombination precursor, putative [Bodo saltans]